MGYTFSNERERRAAIKEAEEQRQQAQAAVTSQRMELANKIAMVVVDRIVADVIRPGPKPEERECYIVAQELRNITSEIAGLIRTVLETEAAE